MISDDTVTGYFDLKKLENTIYYVDCLEIMKKIKDDSIDLIFAEPPYNISGKKGMCWKFSKHVTMQATWDMFG